MDAGVLGCSSRSGDITCVADWERLTAMLPGPARVAVMGTARAIAGSGSARRRHFVAHPEDSTAAALLNILTNGPPSISTPVAIVDSRNERECGLAPLARGAREQRWFKVDAHAAYH